MKKPKLYINNQPIRYSFIQKLINKYGQWEAFRILYRARKAKSIISWINGGLRENKKTGIRYALQPVKDEYDNKQQVEKWINDNLIVNSKPFFSQRKEKTESIRDVLDTVLNF